MVRKGSPVQIREEAHSLQSSSGWRRARLPTGGLAPSLDGRIHHAAPHRFFKFLITYLGQDSILPGN
jgi:hypothetical protein